MSHNYISSELAELMWISLSSSYCNRILDITHNLSLILNIIIILISYMIIILCHLRCDLE